MVKICGITNRDDAVAASEAGAGALGFNFYRGSPRFVAPERAAEIGAGLAAVKVGVFVNEAPARVREICTIAGMDVAQLHGGAAPEGMKFWRACRVAATGEFTFPDDEEAEAFLLDTASEELAGGTGKSFPWTAARAHGGRRIVIAGGLHAGNVQTAIEQARPWGVDACSRIEAAPGRKDVVKMTEFIQAALAARL